MSNYEIFQEGGAPVKAWVKGVLLDDRAKQQLLNVASMPFIFKWVAAMPDAHWGMGATIGSVIATKGAVIPAAVGVDLGCGMSAVQTTLTAEQLPDNLSNMRGEIERAIPVGGPGEHGSWNEFGRFGIPADVEAAWLFMMEGYKAITEKHPKINRGLTAEQLGTLGTGNHFIEVCLDTDGNVWLMLHSGSRGAGNRIGTYFIEKAKQDMRRWFINLPDEDLAYIPDGSELFGDYWNAVKWAQDFAAINRSLMMNRVISAVRGFMPVEVVGEAVNCHHNYISKERHYGENVFVTRKGAVQARERRMGIIPGSMGAKSFIVRGKGNPESFESCSHGAGRAMSRNEAKRKITMAEHMADTAGVECRKDASVIDESPKAYKDIDAVMAAQADLVEIVATLKQVVCVKG